MKYAPLLFASLVVMASVSQAQNIKPGLWEFKQTPQLDAAQQAKMAQAQKAMEGMPPEQRAMFEQMMAKNGVSVGMAGGVITVKSCITKEQAERNFAPMGQQGNCSHETKRSGNVIQTHFVCTNPASEGDATVTLRGSDAFTNDVTIRHQRQGKTATTKLTGEGRWLSADCGTVQPMQPPAK